MRGEFTRVSYWYPKVCGVAPTPRTEILQLPKGEDELYALLDGKGTDTESYRTLTAFVRDAAPMVGGVPLFLRTGWTSGKHFWRDTCHVTDLAKLGHHIYQLVEFSECCDFLGLPVSEWVVREMLAVDSPFEAFGGFPVNAERRYFIRDGRVVCHHPYWPEEAIKHPTSPTWREQLAALNAEPDEQVAELTALSERVAAVLPGAWSVDWLLTRDRGWVLIDMATAATSFHWDGCPETFEGPDVD